MIKLWPNSMTVISIKKQLSLHYFKRNVAAFNISLTYLYIVLACPNHEIDIYCDSLDYFSLVKSSI